MGCTPRIALLFRRCGRGWVGGWVCPRYSGTWYLPTLSQHEVRGTTSWPRCGLGFQSTWALISRGGSSNHPRIKTGPRVQGTVIMARRVCAVRVCLVSVLGGGWPGNSACSVVPAHVQVKKKSNKYGKFGFGARRSRKKKKAEAEAEEVAALSLSLSLVFGLCLSRGRDKSTK